LPPSSIGSTKTHQHIHQWNTVRSVPKPNVFGTDEGDYVKRAGCLERELVNKEPELIRATLYVFPIRLCPHTLQPGSHVCIVIEVDLE
jgi:hypothetical protein